MMTTILDIKTRLANLIACPWHIIPEDHDAGNNIGPAHITDTNASPAELDFIVHATEDLVYLLGLNDRIKKRLLDQCDDLLDQEDKGRALGHALAQEIDRRKKAEAITENLRNALDQEHDLQKKAEYELRQYDANSHSLVDDLLDLTHELQQAKDKIKSFEWLEDTINHTNISKDQVSVNEFRSLELEIERLKDSVSHFEGEKWKWLHEYYELLAKVKISERDHEDEVYNLTASNTALKDETEYAWERWLEMQADAYEYRQQLKEAREDNALYLRAFNNLFAAYPQHVLSGCVTDTTTTETCNNQ